MTTQIDNEIIQLGYLASSPTVPPPAGHWFLYFLSTGLHIMDSAGVITGPLGGLSDGNYGDITISGSGTVLTINNASVSLAKMTNMATASLIGRNTAGTGVPEVLSAATAKSLLSLNNVDNTSDANKPVSIAQQAAIDAAVVGLLDFKGGTDASTNPNYPAASKGDVYIVTVAGKVGGASGKSVDVGDAYFATADNAGGTEAVVGTSWSVLEHNLDLAGIGLTTNPLSQFAATTSAQLRGVLSDETGTGAAVFADTPEFTTSNNTWGAFKATNIIDLSSVPVAVFEGDSATPADNDEAFFMLRLSDSSGNQDEFARIKWKATTVLDGPTEDGSLILQALTNGVLTNFLSLDGASSTLIGHVDLQVPGEAYGSGWNASTEVPTKDAVYDKIESISNSIKTLVTFSPLNNEPPAANYATLDLRNRHPVLDFDGTTDEEAVFTGILPRSYAGGGLTVILHVMFTSATSGSAFWQAAIERMDDASLDLNADSFAAFQGAAGNPNAISGAMTLVSISFTSGAQMDNLAFTAGEMFRLKIRRDADGTAGTDDVTTDAELVGIEIKES